MSNNMNKTFKVYFTESVRKYQIIEASDAEEAMDFFQDGEHEDNEFMTVDGTETIDIDFVTDPNEKDSNGKEKVIISL